MGDIVQNTCSKVQSHVTNAGIWSTKHGLRSHLVSPEPFTLSSDQVSQLERLGEALVRFYHGANELYLRSDQEWVSEYLDIGKPDDLVRHARMHYHKHSVPIIIRPDILITKNGFVITELDSVPGGFGHLDCLSAAYADAGFDIVGSARGIRENFAKALRGAANVDDPVCAIIVSDESVDYLPEMTYLANELRKIGLRAYTLCPNEVEFTENGLFAGEMRIDLVYRFFELFDLLNIPKSELVSYAARKKMAVITPPYKHYLEEKILLALLHNESLNDYWVKSLGDDNYRLLIDMISPTWIMDNRPVPPHAHISGFIYRGRPIRDWREIMEGTQKDRRLVLKPSGFSELAWGSRGVRIGHDMPAAEWTETVDMALSSFNHSPYVIQPFHDGALIGVKYLGNDQIREMQARVRLCPYYFVADEKASLGGVLATACPKDKKLIHGMVDAVMMPCRSESQ